MSPRSSLHNRDLEHNRNPIGLLWSTDAFSRSVRRANTALQLSPGAENSAQHSGMSYWLASVTCPPLPSHGMA